MSREHFGETHSGGDRTLTTVPDVLAESVCIEIGQDVVHLRFKSASHQPGVTVALPKGEMESLRGLIERAINSSHLYI